MEELREVEVVNVSPPTSLARRGLIDSSIQSLVFEITPSATTYRWQADNARDQTKFITSLIRLFKFVTGGTVPLRLIGVRDPDAPASCM